ncbi:hypothetical protein BGX26_011108 [Mortierella sp. AD094]|nr:hypothetical protein BGX26_011108 [Mortierella sp. AD094]
MTYLEESYRPASVEDIFSKLLERNLRLNGEDIKEQSRKVTNYVPRKLVRLSNFIEDKPNPITSNIPDTYTIRRANEFKEIARGYYDKLDVKSRLNFYNALLKTFHGNTPTADFDWDFLDLGLIYCLSGGIYNTTRNHILCLPAQNGLLEQFKELPHHKDVPNSDFHVHEKPDSKKISKAFDDRDDEPGKNQIERYMDEMFGTGPQNSVQYYLKRALWGMTLGTMYDSVPKG